MPSLLHYQNCNIIKLLVSVFIGQCALFGVPWIFAHMGFLIFGFVNYYFNWMPYTEKLQQDLAMSINKFLQMHYLYEH